MTRAGYRVRQMLAALRPRPDSRGLRRASELLPPAQWRLFQALPAAEQAHALRVLHRLEHQGEQDADLLAAALLHDVGKSLQPISPLERALVVFVGRLAPQLRRRWGSPEANGWRRGFVVAQQHPAWGAELLAKTGASPALIELVRLHQTEPDEAASGEDSRRLRALQAADDWS